MPLTICTRASQRLCAGVQGTHTAMKSGMLAAEAAFNALTNADCISPADLSAYEEDLKASWVCDELYDSRNIRPGFAKLGLYGGLAHAAVDTVLLRGSAPWTLRHRHVLHPLGLSFPSACMLFSRLYTVSCAVVIVQSI